ncbi:MAG: response regulator [Flavobacterium sp.]|nr:response regulator [Flavobacterium sp.]
MQIEQYCKEVKIIAICNSGEDGIRTIKSLEPELVFLDIEMPHFNGFEVLNQTKEIDFQVVFTTAYDQFAIKAFKFSAIDYLLKPIDILELQVAVQKVTKSKEQSVSKSSILNLLTQFNTEKNRVKLFYPLAIR